MRTLLLFLLAAGISRASLNTPTETYTAKERAQRFSDRVIVAKPRAAHRDTVDAAEAGERIRVRGKYSRLGGLRVIELEEGESVESAILRLQATGRYEFVEPDFIETPDAVPNDPSFPSQWSLRNTGQLGGSTPGIDIKAEAAWDIIHDAPNVIVATIDNGINLTHRDLIANLWRNPSPTFGDINGASFIRGVRGTNVSDQTGHGSHVAGIIGAVGNNGFNISGVAWKVQLMAVKNSDATGTSSSSDSAACMDYAVAHGAHIINCSFGGASFSQAFLTAIRAARDAGVIVVTSAGNDGTNNDVDAHYPSNFLMDNIVSVGNSGPSDLASASSDFGGLVDLFAPGTSILSLGLTTTNEVVMSGTSMAAPHVTGALALLKAQFPNDNYRQLINRLLRGVDRYAGFTGRAQTGGRLNLHGALTSGSNRPFNDEFATRGTIVGSGITIRANNVAATPEPGEPSHGGVAPTTTIWWQWTAPMSGQVTLSTDGSSYDTVLAVYTGSALSNLTRVATNDDAGGKTTNVVSLNAELGVTYYIAVGGKNGASGLTLVNFGSAPDNDDFANAIVLPPKESLQATGTTLHATLQPGEPKILDLSADGSVWYRWTAPRAGRFQVASFTTLFDTLLGVYTGTAVDRLTLITSSDDTGNKGANTDSLCTFQATSGTTYYFEVEAKDPLVRGEFTLTLTDSLWQFSTEGTISGSPAVGADGTIYIAGGSPDPNLYAIAPDGTMKWLFSTIGTVNDAAPAIGLNGTIFVGATDGRVTALKPDGTVLWQRALNAGSVSVSPALGIDGTLYLHGTDGFLYALHPDTGATLWRSTVSALRFSSAAIGPDGTIYQPSDAGFLYAIRPDGSLKWRFATVGDTFSTPALDAAGNVYFTTYSNGTLYCVTPTGALRWAFSSVGALVSTSPTLSADGTAAYFGATNGNFYAVNTTDGSLRWRTALEEAMLSSTAAVDANGTIYVGCYDNRIYAIDSKGAIKRTWDTAMPILSSPAIAGRTLYIGSGDSKLYALDIGAEAANGTWTQYRRNNRRTGRLSDGALAITFDPRAVETIASLPVTVAVAATGTEPFTFQWFKDGVAVPGATRAILAVTASTLTDAGNYTVTVRNAQGSVTSTAARVALEPLSPPRFINFSVRAAPGAGSQSLVVGFVVGPGSAKPMLLRGVGPGLAGFGITDAMADPQISLATGTTSLASNDNWGGDPAISSAAARVFAFPLAATSRDAALFRTLEPGRYAFNVSGVGTSSGSVLAELFDAEPTPTAAGVSRVTNVSARAQVGTGSNILIAGFTIVGNVPRNVLIRALGPALTGFGVTGVLADPILEIYRGTTLVARNDDWGGNPAFSTVFGQVGAFPLTSALSGDSALAVVIPEGVYTARVTGFLNTTGVALVELYIIP